MLDSWEARHSSSQHMLQPVDADGNPVKLNRGNPSFYQSPSLVCMGGLGVLDPYEVPVVDTSEEKKDASATCTSPGAEASDHVDVTSGWGGMGLRGNHSYSSLHRSPSGGSGGIFFGEESDNEQDSTVNSSNMKKKGSWSTKLGAPDHGPSDDYIKTSHMANFYYRGRSSSHGNFGNNGDKGGDTNTDNRGRPLSASMVQR